MPSRPASGQMRVVETGVAALSQGQHPLLNLCSRGPVASLCFGRAQWRGQVL